MYALDLPAQLHFRQAHLMPTSDDNDLQCKMADLIHMLAHLTAINKADV